MCFAAETCHLEFEDTASLEHGFGKGTVFPACVVQHNLPQGGLFFRRAVHKCHSAGADNALKSGGIVAGYGTGVQGIIRVQLKAGTMRPSDQIDFPALPGAVKIEREMAV